MMKHNAGRLGRVLVLLFVTGLFGTTGLSSAALPLNGIQNGDFENGFAEWTTCCDRSLQPDVVDGRLLVDNAYYGSVAFQNVSTPSFGLGPFVLAFDAAVTERGEGHNLVQALSNWPTPYTHVSARVDFTGPHVAFSVNGAQPTKLIVPADGVMHHYVAVVSPEDGFGVLLMDGRRVLTAYGPSVATSPDMVLLGDVSGCDCTAGLAPTVAYDNVYFGPTQ